MDAAHLTKKRKRKHDSDTELPTDSKTMVKSTKQELEKLEKKERKAREKKALKATEALKAEAQEKRTREAEAAIKADKAKKEKKKKRPVESSSDVDLEEPSDFNEEEDDEEEDLLNESDDEEDDEEGDEKKAEEVEEVEEDTSMPPVRPAAALPEDTNIPVNTQLSLPVVGENPVYFTDLGLHPNTMKAIDKLGYTKMTEVQARTIPPCMAGRSS